MLRVGYWSSLRLHTGLCYMTVESTFINIQSRNATAHRSKFNTISVSIFNKINLTLHINIYLATNQSGEIKVYIKTN